MSLHLQTTAIILKKQPSQEQDLIFTVFTPKQGKLSILAKGVRKITSRRRPVLEIPNLVDLHLHLSKNRYYLDQAQLINSFPNIKKSLTIIPLSLHLIELTNSLILEEKALPLIFELLKNSLELLETNPKSYLIPLTYKIKILTLLGHLPDLKICHQCEKPLTATLNYYKPHEFTLFCPNCLPLSQQSHRSLSHHPYQSIPLRDIKLLNFLQKSSLPEILKIKITPQETQKNQKYLEILLQNYLSRELQSEKVAL